VSQAIRFPREKQFEFLREAGGLIVGVTVREQEALSGVVKITSEAVEDQVFKIGVHIANTTPFATTSRTNRQEVLLSSLVSVHTVLGVQDGSFVSQFAPAERLAEQVARCTNVGTWPVLVGVEGESDTMLSSPIILYDYPQIAPESAGDLFDGTEIDEILSLRIMTLTEEEKREMSQSDERARAMLERTESMPVEQLMKLHGVLRGLRSPKEDTP
jgi:hydrogenase maturation protease